LDENCPLTYPTCNSHPHWLRSTAVEYWSLAGELSMSCVRPAADYLHGEQISQRGQLSLSSF